MRQGTNTLRDKCHGTNAIAFTQARANFLIPQNVLFSKIAQSLKSFPKLVKKHGEQLYTDSDDGWFNIPLTGSNLR